jgi:hypothetical protein
MATSASCRLPRVSGWLVSDRGWLIAGHTPEQIVDVAVALRVPQEAQCHAAGRHTFDLDLALRQQRPQPQ